MVSKGVPPSGRECPPVPLALIPGHGRSPEGKHVAVWPRCTEGYRTVSPMQRMGLHSKPITVIVLLQPERDA